MMGRIRYTALMGCISVLLTVSSVSLAFPAMDPVNRDTLIGTWEGCDRYYYSVLRLVVEAGRGLRGSLVIASEPRPLWFSIEEIVVGEDGTVRFAAVDEEGIVWLEATGKGLAAGPFGNIAMTFRLGQARSDVIWGGPILLGSPIMLVKSDGKLFETLAAAAGKAAQLLKGKAKGTIDPEGVKAETESERAK